MKITDYLFIIGLMLLLWALVEHPKYGSTLNLLIN